MVSGSQFVVRELNSASDIQSDPYSGWIAWSRSGAVSFSAYQTSAYPCCTGAYCLMLGAPEQLHTSSHVIGAEVST